MTENQDTRGERLPRNYALKWPEPIALWKWAARNSRRDDGGALAMVDFFKRSVRTIDRVAGESHEAFVRRALLTETRAVMAARRAAGGIVPLWVVELLAGEVAQDENSQRVGN